MTDTIWWEKTVEYNFVLSAKKLFNLDFYTPLDGYAESIGDLIINHNFNKFFIIEFKKERSLTSEYKKYTHGKKGYNAAKKEMKKNNISWESHYIICGPSHVEEGSDFKLEIRSYFNIKKEIKHSIAFDDGMNLSDFKNYSLLIGYLKKNAGGDDNGDNGDRAPPEPNGPSDPSGIEYKKESNILFIDKDNKCMLFPANYFFSEDKKGPRKKGGGFSSQWKINPLKPSGGRGTEKKIIFGVGAKKNIDPVVSFNNSSDTEELYFADLLL